MLFTSGGGRITNNAGASIAGHGGISFYGDDGIISNHGAVTGYLSAGILLGDFARNVVLNNDGEIYGRSAGVSARSAYGSTLNNSGQITSDRYGIEVNSDVDVKTTINNTVGGTVEGTPAAIYTFAFAGYEAEISLNNSGAIIGDVNCTAVGNDIVVNRGSIDGDVFLGAGNDSFDGRGGTVTGDVQGGAGNDVFLVNNVSASIIEWPAAAPIPSAPTSTGRSAPMSSAWNCRVRATSTVPVMH